MAAFVFSILAEFPEPSPNEDHSDDIPDMTLLTDDTECMDKASDDLLLRARCELFRNDT
jgi:hypothetical protein